VLPVHHVTAANLVTCARIVLALALPAVVVAGSRALLVGVLGVALLSDLVDGRLARRNGTASAFGARLDMEADALLILVLSAVVASDVGWWVLWLGLVRYAFAAVVVGVPRLQAEPPPRPWCKVVAALVGTVLALAAVGAIPGGAEEPVLVATSALLAESFGREALQRWRASRLPEAGRLTVSGVRG
jgi:phosphatidylglycerophosphate synthase